MDQQSPHYFPPRDIWSELIGPDDVGKESIPKIEQKIFLRLVEATSNICRPQVYYYCRTHEAVLPDRIIIAVGIRPVPIGEEDKEGELADDAAVNFKRVAGKKPYQKQLHFVEGLALTQWREQFRSDFQAMCNYRSKATGQPPQFICFPEFAFPYDPQSEKTALHRQQEDIKNSPGLDGKFVFLGSAHTCKFQNAGFAFPHGKHVSETVKSVFKHKWDEVLSSSDELKGSSHKVSGNNQDGLNLTLNIRTPDGLLMIADERDVAAERDNGTLKEPQLSEVRDAYQFFRATAHRKEASILIKKKAAATKLGEYLEPQGPLKFEVFVTPNGVIGVLICYDAYDPALFLSVVRLYRDSQQKESRFSHHGVDILFVPSYNKSKTFVAMCEALSYFTNTVVIYASADPDCKTKAQVFICGKRINVAQEEFGAPKEENLFVFEESEDKLIKYFELKKSLVTQAMRLLLNHRGLLGLGVKENRAIESLGKNRIG